MISEICLKKGPTNVNRSQDNDFLCLSNVEIHTKFVVYFSKVFVDNTCCTNNDRDYHNFIHIPYLF